MACTHKFYGHPAHMPGVDGLLPQWETKTLIIGTLNPEQKWHTKNSAEYYYGRTRNYFWRILPKFTCTPDIGHHNVDEQLRFLKEHKIGLKDLLISVNDADINIADHQTRIQTVLDDKIELFNDFTWNTNAIINFIKNNSIEAVYFTKLGNQANHPKHDTFESQIQIIEKKCDELGIPYNRLHTPSGQGLGKGKPRINNLIHRWYWQNGGSDFQFINKEFKINSFIVDTNY